MAWTIDVRLGAFVTATGATYRGDILNAKQRYQATITGEKGSGSPELVRPDALEDLGDWAFQDYCTLPRPRDPEHTAGQLHVYLVVD